MPTNKAALPPVYPFPEDEILWWSGGDGFTVGEDSYFAVARLDEEDTRVFNGRDHTNRHRLVIHTPVRGSVAMFINGGDLQAMLALATAGLSDNDSGLHGSRGEFMLYDEWLEGYAGVDVEFIMDDVHA